MSIEKSSNALTLVDGKLTPSTATGYTLQTMTAV